MPRRARLRTMRGMLSVWTMSSSSPRDRARLKKNFLVGWYVTVPLSWKPTTIFSHLSLQHTHTHTQRRARGYKWNHFNVIFHCVFTCKRIIKGNPGELVKSSEIPESLKGSSWRNLSDPLWKWEDWLTETVNKRLYNRRTFSDEHHQLLRHFLSETSHKNPLPLLLPPQPFQFLQDI